MTLGSIVVMVVLVSLGTHTFNTPNFVQHIAQAGIVSQDKTASYQNSLLTGTALERIVITDDGPAATVDVWVTAYTSDPAETDDTPFITASGSMVRDGIAAANFLPMGTRFRIPEAFGNKIFVVEDRMNSRYNNQHIVDLWFSEKTDAIRFGKRHLTLEVL